MRNGANGYHSRRIFAVAETVQGAIEVPGLWQVAFSRVNEKARGLQDGARAGRPFGYDLAALEDIQNLLGQGHLWHEFSAAGREKRDLLEYRGAYRCVDALEAEEGRLVTSADVLLDRRDEPSKADGDGRVFQSGLGASELDSNTVAGAGRKLADLQGVVVARRGDPVS